MADKGLYRNFWGLGFFLLFSTIVMGLSVLIIVATNDYAFYQFYEQAVDWVASGLAPASLPANIETVADSVLLMLPFFDKIWAVAFVVFVVNFIYNCYHSRREGYFSMFGFISFGLMALLFALNLLVTYNDALYSIFFDQVLSNTSLSLPLFSYYIENFQIINLILIGIGSVINFVPLDFTAFQSRKDADKVQEDEIV